MKDIFGRFMMLCSRREYCESDILKKLERTDLEEAKAAELLHFLKEEKFVDDRRYAAAFARDKAVLAGWGAEKIRFALLRKKIAPEYVQEALQCCTETDAEDRMRKTVIRKWESLHGEDHVRRVEKTLRFAAGRGYRYAEIMEIIKNLENNISAND